MFDEGKEPQKWGPRATTQIHHSVWLIHPFPLPCFLFFIPGVV
jgi:hypothetical protein